MSHGRGRREVVTEEHLLFIRRARGRIRETEARIMSYDELVNDLNLQEIELEDLIEENNETIERQIELLEVCDDIIHTNELLSQPSGE